MGWGDMLAVKQSVAGGYYLMQPQEGPSPGDIYLFDGRASHSVAGPLHQIGWNQHYIIFTDANQPQPWNVIDVNAHKTIFITEGQRATEETFRTINVLTPAQAWTKARRSSN
jgi:hypothetical protein